MMHLIDDPATPINVEASARVQLIMLEKRLNKQKHKAKQDKQHYDLQKDLFQHLFSGRYHPDLNQLAQMPSGSPI